MMMMMMMMKAKERRRRRGRRKGRLSTLLMGLVSKELPSEALAPPP